MVLIKPYLWKEWNQNQPLALGALGAVFGISFLSLLTDGAKVCQGLLLLNMSIIANILGVYALAREQGRIGGFWHSRPISATMWILSKYATGIIIMVSAFGIFTITQLILFHLGALPSRVLDDLKVFALVHSWIMLAIYSAAFALGQCIRGAINALMLSLSACVVILLVSVIAPLLDTGNLKSITLIRAEIDGLGTLNVAFALGLIVFSVAMVYLSSVFIRKRFQVDLDQRIIAWTTVALLLGLCAATLFPIGTNLTPEKIITLPVKPNTCVVAMSAQDNQALVLLTEVAGRGRLRNRRFGLVRVDVKAGKAPGGEIDVVMTEPLWFLESEGQTHYTLVEDLVWSHDDPEVAYVLARASQLSGNKETELSNRLLTLRLDNALAPVVDDQDLTPLLSEGYSILRASLEQTNLYVYDQQKQSRLLTFSLDKLERPVLISDAITPSLGFNGRSLPGNKFSQSQIGILPDAQKRIRITHDLTRKHAWPWSEIRKDRILASTDDMALTLYSMDKVYRDCIVLRSISQVPRSPIQRLLNLGYARSIDSLDQWAVCTEGQGVTVYRIDDGDEINRVGHYAAGKGFADLVILPNKRVILGNDKLHILKLGRP
jgi:hypothetical protein